MNVRFIAPLCHYARMQVTLAIQQRLKAKCHTVRHVLRTCKYAHTPSLICLEDATYNYGISLPNLTDRAYTAQFQSGMTIWFGTVSGNFHLNMSLPLRHASKAIVSCILAGTDRTAARHWRGFVPVHAAQEYTGVLHAGAGAGCQTSGFPEFFHCLAHHLFWLRDGGWGVVSTQF